MNQVVLPPILRVAAARALMLEALDQLRAAGAFPAVIELQKVIERLGLPEDYPGELPELP